MSANKPADRGAPAVPGTAAPREYGEFRLAVKDVSVSRGGRTVTEGVTFTLDPGGWLELRGPNGGGKTSLLRCLAGLARPESGRIEWAEQGDVWPEPATRGLCAWLGHLDGLQPHFTVRETLEFWAKAGPGPDVAAAAAALGLERFLETPARRLSAGWRRRTGLARLILLDRPLWLLDEPFSNLDDDGVRLAEAAISAHLARGGAAVAATHGGKVAVTGGRVLRLEAI